MGSFVSVVVDTLSAFCIAVSPHNPDVVFWSQWGGKLIRANLSFLLVRDTLHVDKKEKLARITNIVFHPMDSNVIIVGGLMMHGLYRTCDAGKTWSVVHRFSDGMEWFSGESIYSVLDDGKAKFWAASLSSGQLLHSQDDGNSWLGQQIADIHSVCALATDPMNCNTVLLGCRRGTIIRLEWGLPLPTVAWTNSDLYYAEVPRFCRSAHRKNCLYAVTVGFDTLKTSYGVLRSCDGGRSFHDFAFKGMSFWAIDENPLTGVLILGGFSEFSRFPGAGVLAMVEPLSNATATLSLGKRWELTQPSVWDIAIVSSKRGAVSFIVASESGVYFVKEE